METNNLVVILCSIGGMLGTFGLVWLAIKSNTNETKKAHELQVIKCATHEIEIEKLKEKFDGEVRRNFIEISDKLDTMFDKFDEHIKFHMKQ